jgi:hypothetical protein
VEGRGVYARTWLVAGFAGLVASLPAGFGTFCVVSGCCGDGALPTFYIPQELAAAFGEVFELNQSFSACFRSEPVFHQCSPVSSSLP